MQEVLEGYNTYVPVKIFLPRLSQSGSFLYSSFNLPSLGTQYLPQNMASAFRTVSHVVPGQHIREYPTGTKQKQEDVMQLSIKQYIPLRGSEPAPENSLTIIGVHVNGFPNASIIECMGFWGTANKRL